MPTFDTPRPILVDLELGVGNVRIAAGDRAERPWRSGRPTPQSRPTLRLPSRRASNTPTDGC